MCPTGGQQHRIRLAGELSRRQTGVVRHCWGKPKRQLAASELRWPREVEGAKLGGSAWATQARLINKEPREIDLGTD